ncbi:MAG: Asparagine--tRNA ligase [Phycisphaerae bacterium]|nr:Asparagine--tRNA ligase [Phycisphaerae bacterium]
MQRTRIIDALTAAVGTELTVAGWVRTARHHAGTNPITFVMLNDGSCMAALQVVATPELANYEDIVLKLSPGCSVVVTGRLVESQGKGQKVELAAASLRQFGSADAEHYPIQAQRHSFEFLRTIAHLRPRTNTFGAVARVRNAICAIIHEFFQKRGFLYVHTPIITASDCEGAGELFRVTTLPPGKSDPAEDFFGTATNLTVSGQLEVETYCCAMGDVYTFGPTFRAENSNTPRHLAEFWMVEPEIAFADLSDDADLAEEFLRTIFSEVLTRCPEDMAFFEKWIDKEVVATLRHVIDNDFVRLTYTEAIDVLTKAGREWAYAPEWGKDLQTEHERYLTEENFKKPVIVTDYPSSIKPFYMRLSDDGRTVAAMDVLVPRVGEIIGGSQREERLDVLGARMKAQGMNPEDYGWYLDLRRYGTMPHAGFGLGLERAVQFVTGMQNIRDVIPFPRTPGNAKF